MYIFILLYVYNSELIFDIYFSFKRYNITIYYQKWITYIIYIW